MSSTNFRIKWDTISSGGDDDSSSASYLLRDTIGNAAIGNSDSASFDLRAGYRQGVQDEFITFTLITQVSSTETEATAGVGNTVTVDDTSDFDVDDYILLVQDEGLDQISALGQIVSLTATTITVDDFADNGTSPAIDGANDAVFLMSGNSPDLGTLTTPDVSTGGIGWEVTVDSPDGYTVSAYEDGNLRSGVDDINDVSDGEVTASEEEYGARSSDTAITGSTFDTEDESFTTTSQPIADESDPSFSNRHFLTLKMAVADTTQGGSYAHTLTFIATGNY